MLVSVHIPKCGGTSLQHVLVGIFGRKRVLLNYDPAIFRLGQASLALIPPDTQCIHGHFMSDLFDDCLPQYELVTWLRHPVQRVVSHYYHFLRHPETDDPCCRVLLGRRLSLEEFAELDLMRNEMARYLAGKPLSAFKCVGIMERFEESLRAFGDAFGLPIPARPPRENVNPDRLTPDYLLPDRIYRHILALNRRDLALYELAVARLEHPEWTYVMEPPTRFASGWRREVENYLDMQSFVRQSKRRLSASIRR